MNLAACCCSLLIAGNMLWCTDPMLMGNTGPVVDGSNQGWLALDYNILRAAGKITVKESETVCFWHLHSRIHVCVP